MPAKKSSGKSMDITKPNAAPESSSRPIIVTNRPLLQDPMVTDASPTDADGEPKPVASPIAGSSKKIEPLTEATTETEPEDEKVADTGDAPAEPDTDEPEEKVVEINSDDDTKAQAAVVDAVVEGSTKSTEQLADDVEAARQEKVQQLVESKKYIVPLGQVTKRKQNQRSIMILVVLLVIVGAYVAADLGYIPLPFELPFQLFR